MKPLLLELEGLQSYREAQTIDLAAVSDLGTFGIFGPTGAGKSTLLDAILLALFAHLPRATAGARAFVNLDARACRVLFRFSIDDAAGALTITVERRFTKKGKGDEVSVAHDRSRLVLEQVGRETEVVEGKDEVNDRIQRLLGLRVEDFKRAVVLPQGSFDAFLRLRPSDRRDMLERIFGLERFGNELAKRLSAVESIAQNRLAHADGQLAGVAAATDDALIELAVRVVAAEETATKAARALEQAEHVVEGWRERARVEAAFAQARAALALAEKRASEATARKAELDRALAAERLRPLLDDARTLAEQLPLLARSATEARTQASRASVTSEEQSRLRLDAEARADRERPALLEGRARLEGEARPLARELAARTEESSLAGQALARAEKALEAARAAHAKSEAALAAARAALAEKRRLRDEASAIASPETVAQLERAADRRREHSQRAAELADARATFVERLRAEEAARAALARADAALVAAVEVEARAIEDAWDDEQTLAGLPTPDDLERRAIELDRERRATEQLAEADAALSALDQERARREDELARATRAETEATAHVTATERALREVEAALVAARAERERLDELESAARLAHDLVPGKACKTCGSLWHPSKAEPSEPAHRAAVLEHERAATRAVETARAAAQAARDGLAHAHAARVHAARAAAEVGERRAQAHARREEAFAKLSEATRWVLPLARKCWFAEVEAELERDRLLAREARSRVDAALARRASAEQAVARAAGAAEAERVRHEAARAHREAAGCEVARREGVLELAAVELERALAGVLVADLDATLARAREAAARGAMLGAEVGRRESELPALEGALEPARSSVETLRMEREQRHHAHVTSTLAKEQAHERLAALLGAPPEGDAAAVVEKELVRVVAALDALGRAVETARAADHAATTRARELELAARTSEVRLDESRTREADLRARLALELERAGFASDQTARIALRPAGERERLASELRAHEDALHNARERVREVSSERDALLERARKQAEVAGHAPPEENVTPADCERALAEAEKARAAAFELHVGAISDEAGSKRALVELERRVAERKTLEGERSVAARRVARLEQIGELVRGNALVAWVAEEELLLTTAEASARLASLSRGRYRLALDAKREFLVEDSFAGGQKRPVATLSGGETFLTSLALALALSERFQARAERPIKFFFLDEGFGTLDPASLDVAIGALERLGGPDRVIGVISHVEELRDRIQRRIHVQPGTADGHGSKVTVERS